ncbi:maker442 [Drosophila busckii]|uniref:Maker442 n=2 Tax=Drosophila busckii TaxID=30019 RepID=A0A0M4E7N6_DROBS|nr:maker442 [Drosophila busckii]
MGAVDLTAALQITQYSPVGAINNSSSLNYIHALDICSIVCGAIGIISGLMQLIGHYWLIGWVYIIGLGISSLVCFISYGFIFIYAFIVQIFCIIWCTRYYITEAE